MARTVRRGDLWLHQFGAPVGAPVGAPDRRRPILVLTRDVMANRRHSVTVAPVTSTIRGTPTEVRVGVAEGLKHDCVVNLDHLQTVRRSDLRGWIGRLGPGRMFEVCRALNVSFGCEATMVREEPWVFG